MRPLRPWAAFASLCLGFLLVSIDGSIVAIAVPAMAAGLHAPVTAVLWAVTGYLLAYVAPLLVTGWLGDRLGHRRVYLLGLLVVFAGSAAGALAPSAGLLVAGRVVQGLGAALMAPQTLALITRLMPAPSLGPALGLWGASAGAANVLGPALGGALVTAFGWRAVLAVNLPVAALAIVLTLRLVPRGGDAESGVGGAAERRLDAPSGLLSVLAIAALVAGVQQLGGSGSDGTAAVLLLVLGVVFAILLALRQRDPDRRLLPAVLFASGVYGPALLGVFAVSALITAVPVLVVLAAQIGLGLAPAVAALEVLPIGVASMLMQPLVGRLIGRIAPALIARLALLLLAIGAGAVAVSLTGGSPPVIAAAVGLLGLGAAGVWSPLSMLAVAGAPVSLTGSAGAGYNLARQLGAALGAAAATALVHWQLIARFAAGASRAAALRGTITTAQAPQYLAACASVVAILVAPPVIAAAVLSLVPRSRPDV
ncbi:MAG: MFS transporter [Microbacteriaceae bacterium]